MDSTRSLPLRFHPARLGVLINTVAVALVLATLAGLHPDRHEWFVAVGALTVCAAASWAAQLLPWDLLPQPALLVFPTLLLSALVAIGLWTTGLTAAYNILFALGAVFAGLTQSRRHVAIAVPLMLPLYALANHRDGLGLLARLTVAFGVWMLVGLVLADLTSAQRTARAALLRESQIDPLTGISNRRRLAPTLRGLRPGDSLALVDFDHFKTLNDTHGHRAGDEALAAFGELLRTSLRERDLAIRYGGEEFLVVMPSTGPVEAQRALARLTDVWAAEHGELTFSAGVACLAVGEQPVEALERCDGALYAAKRAGRHRVFASAD